MTDKLTECGQIKELLALRVSEDLNVDEAAKVDRHARYCDGCRNRLDSYSDAVGAVREVGAAISPVDDRPSLWQKIEPRLGPAGRQRRLPLAWISTRQLALACTVLLGLTIYLESAAPRQPQAGPQQAWVRQGMNPADGNEFANQVADAVIRPLLGVVVQGVDPAIAKRLGLQSHEGVLVSHVLAASAADLAGLQTADVILSVDEELVRSPQHLANIVAEHPAGTELRLRIFRDGRVIERRVVSGVRQSSLDQLERSRGPVLDEYMWNLQLPRYATWQSPQNPLDSV